MQPKVLCLVLFPSFIWISVTACGSPGNPANGIIKQFRWTDSFEEGDSVEYECRHEYDIVPWSISYRRTCINGSWSGQLPVCAREYETTSRMSLCRISRRTPECDEMPYCLAVDNKQLWKINLDKQYHISVVTAILYGSECDKAFYLNISVSNNSTTRYFDRKRIWSTIPGGPCHYECRMEDNSSPLANTINIAVNNNLPAEQVIMFCNIRFLGKEFPADCGRPDSPPHSVVTYSNDSRTAFFKCKSGYRAVGDNLISRCTDDLRWTKLDMKCMELEGVNDHQLSFILVIIPLGLPVCVFTVQWRNTVPKMAKAERTARTD